MTEPEGSDGELDRHRRDVGRRHTDLERLPPAVEHVAHDARRADPRKVVGAEHPLVVPRDLRSRLHEAEAWGHGGGKRVHDPVVEADHREVRLGDREVLVVPRVGDDRLALGRRGGARSPGEVEPLHPGEALRREGLPHLQVDAVRFVELLRCRIRRTGTVERVEIEAGRARLQQLGRRHVLAEHHARLVERQVMVHELAEIRESGRDLRVAAPANDDRLSQPPPVRLGELMPRSAGTHPRESEGRHQRLFGGRERAGSPSDRLAEETFADDEIALRTMLLHGLPPFVRSFRGEVRPYTGEERRP